MREANHLRWKISKIIQEGAFSPLIPYDPKDCSTHFRTKLKWDLFSGMVIHNFLASLSNNIAHVEFQTENASWHL